jgi:hypothetical protein
MAKQQIPQTDNLFDLPEEVTSSYLEAKKRNEDGLFRPSLEQALDKKNYYATLRILPNLSTEKKLGPTAIEKHIHYAKFPDNQEIQGYFDCMKNFDGEKCELCNMYWALHNSKNPVEQEKKKLIQRSTKYYCYVLVIEDENNKENEGKVMIFTFGTKIKDMIAAQKNHPKKPCKVEDLSTGKDFLFHMKMVAEYINYDSSSFDTAGPLKFKGKPFPVGEDGKIKAEFRDKVTSILLDREKDLSDFAPKKWTEDDREKVSKILGVLSGQYSPSVTAETRTAKAADVFKSDIDDTKSNNDTSEDFFKETVNNASNAVGNTSTSTEEEEDFFADFK